MGDRDRLWCNNPDTYCSTDTLTTAWPSPSARAHPHTHPSLTRQALNLSSQSNSISPSLWLQAPCLSWGRWRGSAGCFSILLGSEELFLAVWKHIGFPKYMQNKGEFHKDLSLDPPQFPWNLLKFTQNPVELEGCQPPPLGTPSRRLAGAILPPAAAGLILIPHC